MLGQHSSTEPYPNQYPRSYVCEFLLICPLHFLIVVVCSISFFICNPDQKLINFINLSRIKDFFSVFIFIHDLICIIITLRRFFFFPVSFGVFSPSSSSGFLMQKFKM